jgi:hypothetical protein
MESFRSVFIAQVAFDIVYILLLVQGQFDNARDTVSVDKTKARGLEMGIYD